MTDDSNDTRKSPLDAAVEHAVETFVYAPIGLLFEGATLLPQLVEKGRNQVMMARVLGKFAVEQGRSEATKAASKLGDQAAGVLDFIGGSLAPTPPVDEAPTAPAPSPARKRPATRASRNGPAKQAARKVAGVTGPSVASAPATPAPQPAPEPEVESAAAAGANGASSLAIPDYDGLSASHVVNRLAGLSADELEAVRRYEAANRGRKTILSKVAQLQSS